MKKLAQFALAIVGLAIALPVILAPVYGLWYIFSGPGHFDGDKHYEEYRAAKDRMGRSESTQLWYDRQHLDIEARRQCINDPKCDYFKLRPADNFMGGDTFQPKPWKQEFDIKIKSDSTKRVLRETTRAQPTGPSTAHSRRMKAIPEEEKTWVRKLGENPTIDYWLGNGFGH